MSKYRRIPNTGYSFTKEPPLRLNYKPVEHMYFKNTFTWLVKELDKGTYYHYCRMPSGRVMCKISLMPF